MPKIQRKSESVLTYREINLLECERLVKEHHYSHRLPSAVKLCYGDVETGPPRVLHACCLMSIATGRWEEPLWELTRLVRLPAYSSPLTKLVSKALGYIRQHSLVDLIVSFADAEEDHHGGIYQSCSWVYDGIRSDRLDGFNIEGEFVPARTCNATYGTSSVTGLKAKLSGKTVEPHFDSGKHCYWKAISRTGMQKAIRLGLRSQGYPKPMLSGGSQVNCIVDAQQRKGIIEMPGINAPKSEVVVVRMDTSNEL